MSKQQKAKSEPAAAKAQDRTQCPNWGKGGQYIKDSNGQRVRVEPEPTAAQGDGSAETQTA